MYRFRLSSSHVQVELVANGSGLRLPFVVVGPRTEVAYLEELLDQDFGTLTLNPGELFHFLAESPWVQNYFQPPELVEGDLGDDTDTSKGSFASQPLGRKLVQAGVIDLDELEQLLEAYRPFADSQRFGEFLRLNMQVPPAVLDLLLNPGLIDQEGFNDQKLGERLISLGFITEAQLQEALEMQRTRQMRIGEVLAAKGYISESMAQFFANARVNNQGQLDYAPS